MRHILLLSAGLLLSACQASDSPSGETAEANDTATVDASADEQAIRGQVDRWHELIRAKDAQGIAGLYTEDGAVMPPNSPIGEGASAIEQTWAGMMQTPGFDLSIVPDEIIVSSSGDMALDRGTYTLKVTPDGAEQIDTGKYVVVWRKVAGEWKAAADIFNSDLPVSAP